MWDLATIIAMNAEAMAKHARKKLQKIKQLSVCETFHNQSKKQVKKIMSLRLFPKTRDKVLFVVANRWPWGQGVYTCRENFKRSLLIDVKYVLPPVTGRFSKLRERITTWATKKVVHRLVNHWWPESGELTTLSDLGKT